MQESMQKSMRRSTRRTSRSAPTARWRRALLLAAGAALAAALSAASASAEEPAGEDPTPLFTASGRELYLRHCSACHGEDGRGDGPVAEELRVPPADLTRIRSRHDGEFPTAELARFIDGRMEVQAHGSREMPVWGRRFGRRLDPETTAEEVVRGNISVLIDYLRSIQRSSSS